jgi:hypothetical protein
MMRKVLLWRRVYVGMSPVVAVPVLRCCGYVYVAGGGCASVAAPGRCVGECRRCVCVCVAGGVAGGVCVMYCVVSVVG